MNWVKEEICELTSIDNNFVSLSIDNTDIPHIGYYDYDSGNGAYMYAYRNQINWVKQTINRCSSSNYELSLALDSKGAPQIAFNDTSPSSDSPIVKLATKTGLRPRLGWNVKAVATHGAFPSLALDAADKPSICYNECNTRKLKFAQYFVQNGNPWQITDIDSEPASPPWIVVDKQGKCHVTYVKGSMLVYATKSINEWYIQKIRIRGAVVLDYPSMAIAQDGTPHISCCTGPDFHTGTNRLYHIFCSPDTSKWIIEAVDLNHTTLGAGILHASIALSHKNKPYISYCANPNSTVINLYFAYRDPLGKWVSEDLHVPTSANLSGQAQGSSLAFDSKDKAHIAYYHHQLLSTNPWHYYGLSYASSSDPVS
jgi:hypothetical protein